MSCLPRLTRASLPQWDSPKVGRSLVVSLVGCLGRGRSLLLKCRLLLRNGDRLSLWPSMIITHSHSATLMLYRYDADGMPPRWHGEAGGVCRPRPAPFARKGSVLILAPSRSLGPPGVGLVQGNTPSPWAGCCGLGGLALWAQTGPSRLRASPSGEKEVPLFKERGMPHRSSSRPLREPLPLSLEREREREREREELTMILPRRKE